MLIVISQLRWTIHEMYLNDSNFMDCVNRKTIIFNVIETNLYDWKVLNAIQQRFNAIVFW